MISKFQLAPLVASAKSGQNSGSEIIKKDQILPLENGNSGNGIADAIVVPPQNKKINSYETIANCFSDANPNNDWEKALFVATYLQLKNSLSDFTSFDINKELKNLGHPSGNITNAFSASIEKRPQLILQLRKDGSPKQAQKKYKVSAEGIK
ncbi:MAG: hypothetical protein ABI091_19805 [Ferruginibacter sp.]